MTTMENDENTFVRIVGEVESGNDAFAPLGDNGHAAGQYQQHPSFYASWQPTIHEIDVMGGDPSWDRVFEFALRRFWRARPLNVAMIDVAMAYHLHGQHVYTGDDPIYRAKLRKALGL